MRLHRLILAITAAALLALPVSAAAAHGTATARAAARPKLCLEDNECGSGVWGAKHHGIWFAEHAANHRNETVHLEKCKSNGTNKKGSTQWTCEGYYGNNGPYHWRDHMDPYGELVGELEVYL